MGDIVEGQFDPPRPAASGGGGGDGRLAGIEARLAVLEERTRHLATREDLQKAMNKMLFWGVGIMATVVIGLAAVILRWLS